MRNKITMEMSICQAENGFSLDELVKNVADAYEKKVFAGNFQLVPQLSNAGKIAVETRRLRQFNQFSSLF